MKNVIQPFLTFTLIFTVLSCELDSFLYSNDKKVETYNFNKENTSTFSIEKGKYEINDDEYIVFPLESDDNGTKATIYVAYIGDTSRIKTDTIIVYCHGNSSEMNYSWNRVRLLAYVGGKNNYGVVMLDYRGYGLSGGETTVTGFKSDVVTVLKWLKNKGLNNERTIIYGYSLGSFPAIAICGEPDATALIPNKLILESPVANMDVLIQDGLAISAPIGFFSTFNLNNAEMIKNVKVQPLLLINGLKDYYINYDTHGKVVYQNYQGVSKKLREIPNASHNDIPPIMGFEEYIVEIEKFIKE